MSSYSNGCMVVILPEKQVDNFENYFNENCEYSFLNTKIILTDAEPAEEQGYQKRIYDISCNTSLESCLIENEDNDIRDVCKDLGITYLDIDAGNSEEGFNEAITYDIKDGVCKYYSDSWIEGKTEYDVKGKGEVEAE